MPYSTGQKINKQFLNDVINRILHLVQYVPISNNQGISALTGDSIYRDDFYELCRKIDIAVKSMEWKSESLVKWVKATTWADPSLLGSDTLGILPLGAIAYDTTAYYSESELVSLLTQEGYDIVSDSSTNYYKYSRVLYWNSINTLLNTVFKYYHGINGAVSSSNQYSLDHRFPFHVHTNGYSYLSDSGHTSGELGAGTYYDTVNPTTGDNPTTVNSTLNGLLSSNTVQLGNFKNDVVYYVRGAFRLDDYKAWVFDAIDGYFNYHQSSADASSAFEAKVNTAIVDVPTAVNMKMVVKVLRNYISTRTNGGAISYSVAIPDMEYTTGATPYNVCEVSSTSTFSSGINTLKTTYTDLSQLNAIAVPNATNPSPDPNNLVSNLVENRLDIESFVNGVMVEIPDMP